MAELKRNMIELIVNPQEVAEGGEPEIKKYWTPAFISYEKTREAMELAAELEEKGNDPKGILTMLDKLENFTVEIYNNQFTVEELRRCLHAPDGLGELANQLRFISDGQQSETTKKFLAKKN